jgi:uncharacterized protein with PQ loop repeat
MKLNMFRAKTPPIIRSIKLYWQPLVLHTWKVVGRVVGGRCQGHCAWQGPPTTLPTTLHVCKSRACQCSFMLLMMDGVSPETCWVLYKYGIINFLIHFCILLDFSLRTQTHFSEVQTHIFVYRLKQSPLIFLWEIYKPMNLVIQFEQKVIYNIIL